MSTIVGSPAVSIAALAADVDARPFWRVCGLRWEAVGVPDTEWGPTCPLCAPIRSTARTGQCCCRCLCDLRHPSHLLGPRWPICMSPSSHARSCFSGAQLEANKIRQSGVMERSRKRTLRQAYGRTRYPSVRHGLIYRLFTPSSACSYPHSASPSRLEAWECCARTVRAAFSTCNCHGAAPEASRR